MAGQFLSKIKQEDKNLSVILIGILAAAFILRIFAAFYLHPDEITWPDGHRYLRLVTQLLDNGSFPKALDSEPFYPFVWASVYAIFGRHLVIMRVFLALAGTLLCYVVYGLGTMIKGKRTGLIACAIAAVYPLYIYLSRTCEYPNHLFTLFFAVTVLLAVSILKYPEANWRWILCGFFLGISALTVPTVLVFAPFMALLLLLGSKLKFSASFLKTAVLTLVCVIVLLSFSGIWYLWHGELKLYPFQSYRAGLTFFKGNSELYYVYGDTEYDCLFKEDSPELEQHPVIKERFEIHRTAREVSGGDAYLKNQYYTQKAVEWIRKNPRKFYTLLWRKFLAYWKPYVTPFQANPDDSFFKRLLQAVSYLPVLILAICGVVISRGNLLYTAPLILAIVTQCFVYTLTITNVRYRSQIDVFLIVFAAIAIDKIWGALQDKRRSVS